MGVDVTVIETAVRPLARVTSPEVAGFFLDEHTRQGVRFVLGGQPALIKGREHVTGVALSDGSEVPADIVIAGIGITPEITLAQQCGLGIENGIVTDRQCRTSDPAIYAIGDCAARPIVHFEQRVARLESVHNAVEGAKIVAAAKVEAEQQTVRARESLREQVAALAVKGAEQILRKEVNAGVHADLLSRLKTEL